MNAEKEKPDVDCEEAAEANAAADEGAVEETILEEPEGESSELLKKLDEAQSQAREFQDRLLRVVADQENYRKRAVREREQMRRFGATALIEALLPVVDNLQIGLETAHQHPEASAVTEGFSIVATQIENVLKEYGVKQVSPMEADPFNPNVHEAVAHQPHEEISEGNVILATRKGYLLHDRLIRPASVVVSSGTPVESTE